MAEDVIALSLVRIGNPGELLRIKVRYVTRLPEGIPIYFQVSEPGYGAQVHVVALKQQGQKQ